MSSDFEAAFELILAHHKPRVRPRDKRYTDNGFLMSEERIRETLDVLQEWRSVKELMEILRRTDTLVWKRLRYLKGLLESKPLPGRGCPRAWRVKQGE